MRFLLGCIFVLATLPIRADDDELRQKIVGSWKLVSVVYENQQTNERTPVLGEGRARPMSRSKASDP